VRFSCLNSGMSPLRKKRRTRKRKSKRRIRGGGTTTPTFHVLIVTAGRPTLKGMLDSLQNELKQGDALTIVFDGEFAQKNSGYKDDWISGFTCPVAIKEQVPSLKNWGHPTLNKNIPLLSPVTMYIMFADDDDTYIPGSFDILRTKCTDPNTLYISKMRNPNIIPGPGSTKFSPANIGKPNGIIPFNDAGKAQFGNARLSDYEYYKNLQDNKKVAAIVFMDDIIYVTGRDEGNPANSNIDLNPGT